MKFVRLTLLCPAGLQSAANDELAGMLGPAFASTFETVYVSGATKYYFAGWQGDPDTADKIRAVCESVGVECYDTPPEGVPVDASKEELALAKSDTPKGEKTLLYPQSVVLGALKPEALK